MPNVTHASQRLSYAERSCAIQALVGEGKTASRSPLRSTSPPTNKFGQNFARADRFNYEERFYCNTNGQSAYVGPGAYEGAEQLKKLQRQPCSALLKKSSQLGPAESREGCYVMAGHVLKFEPGLLKYYKEAGPNAKKMTQKEMFK